MNCKKWSYTYIFLLNYRNLKSNKNQGTETGCSKRLTLLKWSAPSIPDDDDEDDDDNIDSRVSLRDLESKTQLYLYKWNEQNLIERRQKDK